MAVSHKGFRLLEYGQKQGANVQALMLVLLRLRAYLVCFYLPSKPRLCLFNVRKRS